MRVTSLTFLFCLFTFAVFGQVKAKFNLLPDGSRGEKTIAISWDDAEAKKWKEENDGRLEIMALKADLHSHQLPKSQTDVTTIRFLSSQKIQFEFLVNFEFVSSGESIEFIDQATGKIISAHQSVEKGKILFGHLGI